MAFPIQRRAPRSRRHVRGITLIELMVAMLLGLLVTAAASGVFLANKRIYATSETLNRVQENTRVSFELMSRDLREAAGNPCGASSKFVNLLQSRNSAWWSMYRDGLRGYGGGVAMPGTTFGSAAGQRVTGTDAVDLHLANDGDYTVTGHSNPSAVLEVNHTVGLQDSDIVMACNTNYALIFQITGLPATGGIQHSGGGSHTPGNCGQEFQHIEPTTCAGASAAYGYCMMVTGSFSSQCTKKSDDPALVARIYTARWYIGNNGRGSRSLYRARVSNRTMGDTPDQIEAVEVAEGVDNMTLQYRLASTGGFVNAAGVADWRDVNAVRVSLEVEGVAGALSGSYIQGTDGEAINRDFSHVVAIRNREGVL